MAVRRGARGARNRHDGAQGWSRRALDALAEAVLVVGGDGRVAYANPTAEAELGWTGGALVGRDLHESLCGPGSLDEGDAPHPATACPALAALGEPGVHRRAEEVLHRRDGTRFAAAVASSTVVDAEPPMAVVSFHPAGGERRATAYYGEILRLTERERSQREVLRQLQEAVTPRVPTVAGVELGVFELAAEPTEPSGGDLYDWVVLPDGDLHVVVVDVMGKGVPATKDALAVVHALRVLTYEGCPMASLVARADHLLTTHDPNLVATLLVARYTPATGRLRLAGGGHPPAFLVSPDGSVREVAAPGIPIGWPEAGSFEVVELEVGRSDTVLLYTDGLIEARRDIVAGLADLEAVLAETARYPVRHLPRVLVERALEGAQRADDTLALVLRRRVAPADGPARLLGPFEHRFSPVLAAVPLARSLLLAWLEGQGVEEEDRADLAVVASELCSNAVRVAGGAAGGLSLRAEVEGDALVVEVEDDGAGFAGALPSGDDVPPGEGERGRGLFVVQALVDEVEVFATGGGSVVRCVKRCLFPLPRGATPAPHQSQPR